MYLSVVWVLLVENAEVVFARVRERRAEACCWIVMVFVVVERVLWFEFVCCWYLLDVCCVRELVCVFACVDVESVQVVV